MFFFPLVLRVFDSKVLRKIIGPVRVGDDFRIRYSTVSCMSSSTTWTLCSILISSSCAGSAMSFVWRKMLRQDKYLMRGSAEVEEEDDFVSVGRTKSIEVTNRRRRARSRGAWKDMSRQAEIR